MVSRPALALQHVLARNARTTPRGPQSRRVCHTDAVTSSRRWYSADRRIRSRQLGLDAALVGWIAFWVVIAGVVSRAIARLTEPLQSTVSAAEGLRDNVHDAANGAATLPVGGGQLRPPLEAVSNDVNGLVASLNDQIRLVENTAQAAFALTVVAPTVLFLLWWLPRRLRTTRARGSAEATNPSSATEARGEHARQQTPTVKRSAHASDAVDGATRLRALRALLTADEAALLAASDDPVSDWAAGDLRVTTILAAMAPSEQRPGLPAGPER